MTCFLLTFLLTTAFWFGLMGYGLKRLISHIKCNPESKATTLRMLTQLLGRDDKPTE